MAFKEGSTNIPQQAFVQWNDPQGTKLVSLNRDGTVSCQGINFPDGTSQITNPVANVLSFGAIGNGIADDTSAIQSAIDYVHSLGGGVVEFPANHTFLISNGSAIGEYGILTIYSNITLIGLDQNTSIIKVADGTQRNTANWNFFFVNNASNTALKNVVFDSLVFDHNGTKNLVSAAFPAKRNAALFAAYAHDIVIQQCTFLNNAGQQTLSFGANISPQTCQRIHIRNNVLHNAGSGVAGNGNQIDHSSIYLQADDSEVINNTAYNDSLPLNTTTAFEIHARRTRVQGNTIDTWFTAMNLVATAADFTDNLMQNNNIINVNIGFRLWNAIGFTFFNNRIDNNRIVLASTNEYGGIYGGAELVAVPQNLEITGNLISQSGSLAGNKLRTAGIFLILGDDITISGNKIFQLSGRGIDLFGTVTRLSIQSNTIFDTGQGGNVGGYTQAIAVHTTSTITNLKIVANQVYNVDGANYITTGVYLSGIINLVTLLSNVFSVATELNTSTWTGSGLFFVSSNPVTATSATAGSNGDVPVQVDGYLVINIGGVIKKMPYYQA